MRRPLASARLDTDKNATEVLSSIAGVYQRLGAFADMDAHRKPVTLHAARSVDLQPPPPVRGRGLRGDDLVRKAQGGGLMFEEKM